MPHQKQDPLEYRIQMLEDQLEVFRCRFQALGLLYLDIKMRVEQLEPSRNQHRENDTGADAGFTSNQREHISQMLHMTHEFEKQLDDGMRQINNFKSVHEDFNCNTKEQSKEVGENVQDQNKFEQKSNEITSRLHFEKELEVIKSNAMKAMEIEEEENELGKMNNQNNSPLSTSDIIEKQSEESASKPDDFKQLTKVILPLNESTDEEHNDEKIKCLKDKESELAQEVVQSSDTNSKKDLRVSVENDSEVVENMNTQNGYTKEIEILRKKLEFMPEVLKHNLDECIKLLKHFKNVCGSRLKEERMETDEDTPVKEAKVLNHFDEQRGKETNVGRDEQFPEDFIRDVDELGRLSQVTESHEVEDVTTVGNLRQQKVMPIMSMLRPDGILESEEIMEVVADLIDNIERRENEIKEEEKERQEMHNFKDERKMNISLNVRTEQRNYEKGKEGNATKEESDELVKQDDTIAKEGNTRQETEKEEKGEGKELNNYDETEAHISPGDTPECRTEESTYGKEWEENLKYHKVTTEENTRQVIDTLENKMSEVSDTETEEADEEMLYLENIDVFVEVEEADKLNEQGRKKSKSLSLDVVVKEPTNFTDQIINEKEKEIALKYIVRNLEQEMDKMGINSPRNVFPNVRSPEDIEENLEAFKGEIKDDSTKIEKKEDEQETLKEEIIILQESLEEETRLREDYEEEIQDLKLKIFEKDAVENKLREELNETLEKLGTESVARQSCENMFKELMEKYGILTLSVENEMKNYKKKCIDFSKLKKRYAELEDKYERHLSGSNACEGENDDLGRKTIRTSEGGEEEEKFSQDLQQSLKVVLSVQNDLRQMIKVLNGREEESLEMEDELGQEFENTEIWRSEFLGNLEKTRHWKCEGLENILKQRKTKYDLFFKTLLQEFQVTLLEAVSSGTPILTRLILENGADINVIDEGENTALHHAAEVGDISVANLLLEAGAILNARNRLGMTALHVSLSAAHVNFSLMLLRRKIHFNLIDSRKNTALHFAALTGNLVIVKALIDEKANVNAVDVNGDTPIFNSAICDDVTSGEALYGAGASLTVTNDVGSTPLHLAAWEGSLEFCYFLLDNNASPDVANQFNVTPLHLAAMENYQYIVELLIQAGASPNSPEENINTPLHYAAKYGNLFMAEILLEAYADVMETNDMKWTPLHFAASGGFQELTFFLLENGSIVDALDRQNRTPLHVAAILKNNICVLDILIAWGADINAEDCSGKTARDLSIECGNTENAQWMAEELINRELWRRKDRQKRIYTVNE